MGRRPPSLPDYQWPAGLLSKKRAPRRWACSLIFHLACFAGRLLSRLRKSPSAILVIRTDGIGDAVLFEPALRSLALSFPGREIHLWSPAATCDLLAGHPAVSSRRVIPRGGKAGNLEYFSSIYWRAVMGWRLGRHQFETAIYAVQSPEPLGNWILSCVRASAKWYSPGDTENQFDWQRKRTTEAATRLLDLGGSQGHEFAWNARLAEQWGGATTLPPELQLQSVSRWVAQAQTKFWRENAARNSSFELIGIMAGSATGVNAYPIDSWARAIRSLWQTRRASFILFGGPGDADRIDAISHLISDIPHRRLSPGTSLQVTAALLREIDGLVSMDTGLAHVALAQRVPTVVIANGGHPDRFFPWPIATRSVVLTHRMPCDGCLCRCVLAEPECVTRISPDDVVAAYESLTRPAVRTAA